MHEYERTDKFREEYEKAKQYWQSKFSGEIDEIVLPYDFKRSLVYKREAVEMNFGEELPDRLLAMSKDRDILLYVILLAALKVLISKYTDTRDVSIASPVYSDKIAPANTDRLIIFRDILTGGMDFKNLLINVKQTVIDGYENQYYVIENILDVMGVNIPESLSARVILLLENIHQRQMIDGILDSPVNDIGFFILRTGSELSGRIEYNAKLFKKETIKEIRDRYFYILEQVLSDLNVKLSDIDILSGEEKQQVLHRFNDTAAEQGEGKVIHRCFEEAAEKFPGNTAVLFREETWSYEKLNNEANRLAAVLVSKGVRRGTVVALMMESSCELPAALLGVLKAGGTYLPIDRESPDARKRYMLADSRAGIVVTQKAIYEENRDLFRRSGAAHIVMCDDHLARPGSAGSPGTKSKPGDPAYIIFTSGTTGEPKGVLVEHRGIVNYAYWRVHSYRLTGRDAALQLLSYTFDGYNSNLYSCLFSGGAMVEVPDAKKLDFNYIRKTIKSKSVTNISLVPKIYELLLDQAQDDDLKSMRFVVLAGDKAGKDLIRTSRKTNPQIKPVNEYGPTETTVTAAGNPEILEINPAIIGRPIANTSLYILDDSLKTVPIGIPGEIYIAGTGVSKGYLNSQPLTNEKFTANPFARGERMYRTGDRGRWLKDGAMEFMGRVDRQVKIRGLRIEPGEIENLLLKMPQIKEAVVAYKEKGAEKYLCVYFVSRRDIEISEIRAFLLETLPDYMIPSYFMRIAEIPLNSNGKIDRKALPEPEIASGAKYAAPRDGVEKDLVRIWSVILNTEKEQIGIDTNFFEIGGHSLRATILSASIQKELNVKIPLVDIFETPTIRGLSAYVKTAGIEKYSAITSAEKKEYYALSSAQKRLYILQQMEAGGIKYNLYNVVPLAPDADIKKIEDIFKRIAGRHESFRTCLRIVDDVPVQRIHDKPDLKIVYFSPEEVDEAGGVEKTIKDFVKPFDLFTAPLLRVGVIRTGNNQNILIFDMHHIISDGMSQVLLEDEFRTLYAEKKLAPLRLQYKDYSIWQNSREQRESIKKQKNYWLKLFRGKLPVLNLPLDYPRPSLESTEGASVSFVLSGREMQDLRNISLQNDLTLNMTILTIFNILFARLSGQEDIIIGMPVFARRHIDLEKIAGMFVNALAIRNYPASGKRLDYFFKEVKIAALQAYENQEYQFEDLVDDLQVSRDTGRNPVFDVLFNYLKQFEDRGGPAEFEEKTVHIERYSKYDMTLSALDMGDGIYFDFEYCRKLFKAETIDRFIRYFKNLIHDLSVDTDRKIADVEIIPAEEKQQVLHRFNDTKVEYPFGKVLHRIFADRVEKEPGRIAAIYEDQALTYSGIDERAGGLCGMLQTESGIRESEAVGLFMSPSIEILPAIIAILEAQAVCLPIDVKFPGKRVETIIADSGARVVLTDGGFVPGSASNINVPGLDRGRLVTYKRDMNDELSGPDQPAYIIYTSGSTGRPKGVLLRHGGIANHVFGKITGLELTRDDRLCRNLNIAFVASIWQFFAPLFTGAELYIYPEDIRTDPYRLFEKIAVDRLTAVEVVPSQLHSYLEMVESGKTPVKLNDLRLLILTGEKVVPALIDRFNRRYRLDLVNAYGQSECSDDTLHYRVPKNRTIDRVPIGKPIGNITLYVTGKDNQIQPIGVPGELHIAGEGLAAGYLNNPEFTEEMFPVNPFRREGRMYRTGDLVRWLPDGSVEFLNRIDRQVKVRGFRIELEEIEAHLLHYDGIKNVVVDVIGDDDKRFICAYCVADPVSGLDEQALKEFMSKELPGYMVPARFVSIDSIPLTASGKVDRKALAAADLIAPEEKEAAGDDIEERLIALWSQVLGLGREEITVNSSFFELGGNSLNSVIMIGRISKTFNVEITLVDVFETKTVRGLASIIKERGKIDYSGIKIAEKKEYYDLSSAQKRLYILGQMEGGSTGYNNFMPVILEGEVDREKLAGVFAAMIRRHESLRTSFELQGDLPVQRVHDPRDVEFHIGFYETGNREKQETRPVETQDLASLPEPGATIPSPGGVPEGRGGSERRGEPCVPPPLRTETGVGAGLAPARDLPVIDGQPQGQPLQPNRDSANDVSDLINRFLRPFDLSAAPLLRAGLLQVSETAHILMMDMHHIVSDGTSLSLFVKECMALYAGETLNPLRIQYKDFSCWQNSQGEQQLLEKQEGFWLRQYGGEIPVLDLPLDYPRPVKQSFTGERLDFVLGREEARGLKALALREDATLHMVLTALYSILLGKLSGSEDVIIGLPTAGRKHADLENVFGMFVNTLALRHFPGGDKTFASYLQDVRSRTLEAFENRDYPFEELVEKVAVVRDTGRNPIFDVMFVLQNFQVPAGTIPEAEIPGLKLAPYKYEDKTSIFDLTLFAREAGDGLAFTFEYDTGLFNRETVAAFIDYFGHIVGAVLADINREIARIEIIPREDKAKIMHEFNDRDAVFPADKAIHRVFADQAARTPERTALVYGAAQLSYRELNRRSSRLAAVLKDTGIAPAQLVAIMTGRCIEMVVGIFAILKAGAGYLPLDPAYPAHRTRYMLADSGVKQLLTGGQDVNALGEYCRVLDLCDESLYADGPGRAGEAAVSLADPAYVIYTSGSTGQPKGVAVEHGAILNTLCSLQRRYPFFSADVYLLKTYYIFDVSLTELFGWFREGGKLAVLEQGKERDPLEILSAVERFGVSHINFIPSMFNAFVDMLNEKNTGKLAGLRYIFLAGEALHPSLVEAYRRKVSHAETVPELENIYGPTEAAVYGSWYSLSGWSGGRSIPIGSPLYNVELHVLDRYGNMQPIGIPGELYIGGKGLAAGYLNQPELTDKKFIYYASGGQGGAFRENCPPAPPAKVFDEDRTVRSTEMARSALWKSFWPHLFSKRWAAGGKKLYKTGDLARWLSDGSVEFFGRLDDQVKVRGYRIELGEIESRLTMHEQIREAVVLTAAGRDGVDYLCAYIVGGVDVPVPDIRVYLKRYLPDYMIPSYFMQLDKLPLTPGGKIDRRALPVPGIRAAGKYEAPQDDLQAELAGIWSEVLEIEPDKIGIDANFFELGGHSLRATIMAARIHKRLNVMVPLVEIFNAPTIAGLAAYIKDARLETFTAINPAEKKEYYPLSSAQRRLYFLQQLDVQGINYNMPYSLLLEKEIDIDALERTFTYIIDRHESLRTSFVMLNNEVVQVIDDRVDFKIECHNVGIREKQETRPVEKERRVGAGLAPARDSSVIDGQPQGVPLQPNRDASNDVTGLMNLFLRPFDLSQAPLLRVGLVEMTAGRYILLLDMHHIITDGVSQNILASEFMSRIRGEHPPALKVHYKDYSAWQSKRVQLELMKQQEKYWVELFSDELPVLNIPADYPRPKVRSFEGASVQFLLPEQDTRRLKEISKETDVTLFMIILTLVNILLAKLGSREDLIVGTTVTARRHADLERIVGMFVNTLALRNHPEGEKTLAEFLEEVKWRVLDAYENQEYPFEDLVDRLNVTRDTGRNPIVDVMINLLNQAEFKGDAASNIEPGEHRKSQSKFDLTLTVVDFGKNLGFIFEYCTKLYKPATINRFIYYYREILSSLTGHINRRIAAIDVVTEEEKKRLLYDFNKTAGEFSYGKTVGELFSEQVEKTPGALALEHGEKQITYRQLDRKANRLAYVLRKKGVRPDVVVGLMIERSLEMMIGMLAILKAGGAYLPIEPGLPGKRVLSILGDSSVSLLLTSENSSGKFDYTELQEKGSRPVEPVVTRPRQPVRSFDLLPLPDRTLIDYKKYHRLIGNAPVKKAITIQSSRGCPFNCIFCHKIWPSQHVVRSAEHIFGEMSISYDAGIRRFVFLDDIFNLNVKNSSKLLKMIIQNKMDIQLFFPNGLRADVFSKDYIDLLAEAGTVNFSVALETASPRIQEMIRKNLDIDKFQENVDYIITKYPHIILEMELMLGFPSETEAEAKKTLDFLKNLKWVHFPNLNILKIYPHTDIAKIAIGNGISEKLIEQSSALAFHEIPGTLPYSKKFVRECQANYMSEYFLLKERLLSVLPNQMKILTEDELVKKYDSYLPMSIKGFSDLLELAGISSAELGDAEVLQDDFSDIDNYEREIKKYFPEKKKDAGALNVLFLDLSQSFTADAAGMLYDVVEAPLGLMYLSSYLNEKLGSRINGSIAKSRIDFDSFFELKELVARQAPRVICIRTLSFYKSFFHRAVSLLKTWYPDIPVISGGPYATSDYETILNDRNVDIVCLGEGEVTLCELLDKMIENRGTLPSADDLAGIPGIAFAPRQNECRGSGEPGNREVLMTGALLAGIDTLETGEIPGPAGPGNLAYLLYTSGSTGTPKGVAMHHGPLVNLVSWHLNDKVLSKPAVTLQYAAFGFDVFFQEIFTTWSSGGKLVIIDEDVRLDVSRLPAVVDKKGIERLFLPYVALRILAEAAETSNHIPAGLREIIVAGEQLKITPLIHSFLKKLQSCRLYNHYGPIECHVVTSYVMGNSESGLPQLPPIGRPVSNSRIYLFDRFRGVVPPGVTGEIYIGGAQVARGYFNRPELTVERFIPNPMVESECLYRTGDLGHWQPDGNLVFTGRVDRQVKVRGFRVELEEIENQLLNIDHIVEAAVVVRQDGSGNNLLCAYVVLVKGQEDRISPGLPEIRGKLLGVLPAYMMPSYFVPLEEMPVTVNGKVDKRALPDPELVRGEDYIAPETELEIELVQIWSAVLSIEKEKISLNSNFFDLGGNSLSIVQLNSRLKEKYKRDIQVIKMFDYPTVSSLARYLAGEDSDRYEIRKKEKVEIEKGKNRLKYLKKKMSKNQETIEEAK